MAPITLRLRSRFFFRLLTCGLSFLLHFEIWKETVRSTAMFDERKVFSMRYRHLNIRFFLISMFGCFHISIFPYLATFIFPHFNTSKRYVRRSIFKIKVKKTGTSRAQKKGKNELSSTFVRKIEIIF